MKLLIVGLLTLSAFCTADLQEPERKIISPDFLFTSAWEYQVKLQEFQGDINGAIQALISAVSDVLKSSTATTLQQYEDHVNEIEDLYAPALGDFNRLKPGSCRNSAEIQLNETTLFSGFKASNCASSYNIRVKAEVDSANKALINFDDVYSQVQSIVIKAFVGQNAFLTPEDIQDKITEIYELIEAKWEETKPEIESVKANLAARIANQNTELGKCHGQIMTETTTEFLRFSRLVEVCTEFENTPSAFDRFDSAQPLHEQLLQEFLAEHAKLKLYEWTA